MPAMLTASRRLLLVGGCLALAALLFRQAASLHAAKPDGPAIDFNRQILPILSDNCFACHGPDEKQRKAKLRLDTKEGAFAKLKSEGYAIVPGKSSESAIVERISSDESSEVMPPPKSGKKLTAEQKSLFKQWIDQGAKWSQHWAFVLPRRPGMPRVSNSSWPRNPLDYFILARLEAEGLPPSQEADKTTLIRRVTLDLTGLPPTPAEVDAFLGDRSAGSYERLVDRLLESPRYGEHMTRYWLDAARYGDTHGLHLDNYREMWPYREWVINAFNRNLPYDQFVVEQLAGDLLPNPTLDQLVASGFNRCHVTTSEGGSIDEEVYVRNVVDRVDTTGTVFLGLTVGCARCHDHKYDPVKMKDYYSLFAFFNSLDQKPLDGNAAQYPPIVKVAPAEQLAQLQKLAESVEAAKRRIADELAKVKYVEPPAPANESGPRPQGDQATHSLSAWQQAQKNSGGGKLPKPLQQILKTTKRTDTEEKQLHDYFIENVYIKTRPTFEPLQKRLREAEARRDRLDKQLPATLVSLELKEPRPAYMLKRGEYDRRGDKVGRGTPGFLPPLPADVPTNRLGFARWLVAPTHPLTARVAVNRLWQQCFGTGLVKTAEDFGFQGEPPSHSELLDWLAVQFREDGWDVKKMMKRLVMSATYRQSSRATPDRLAKDPGNRLLSRGPRFRLDAEMLRDQALAVSGLMVERLGGPSVKPPQPSGLWEAVGYVTSNTRNFAADHGIDKVHRRSLYTFWKRTASPPQMNTFDAPSREACTVRRERTNTPLQALLLLNETQYVECARSLAERAMRSGGPKAEERITFMFRLAAARHPDAKEMSELLSVYRDHLAEYSRDGEAAKKLIAVGESTPDPAFAPSDLAAWTMIANLILNLDEVMNKG